MKSIEIFGSIRTAIQFAKHTLKNYGSYVKTESWQGVKNPAEMFEFDNLYFRAKMPSTRISLEEQTGADMPWAEDHFKERVGGLPLNPGVQYKNWPGYKDKDFNDRNFRNVNKQFSHTYMERYWPTRANSMLHHKDADDHANKIHGIRYEYGDLDDVINLLAKEPYTRQAYLPVWFPEDTGVLHGGRVPCTIGYHFMRKGQELHIHYMIRACDYIRHFRNDIYLTVRLAQWVLEKLQILDSEKWGNVEVGIFTMDIIHFHVFYQERNLIV